MEVVTPRTSPPAPSLWVAPVRRPNPSRSSPVGLTRHTCGDRGHPRDGAVEHTFLDRLASDLHEVTRACCLSSLGLCTISPRFGRVIVQVGSLHNKRFSRGRADDWASPHVREAYFSSQRWWSIRCQGRTRALPRPPFTAEDRHESQRATESPPSQSPERQPVCGSCHLSPL
jgi:hypothetical protein